ncbi:MAG: hypothetical protein BJG00_005485 [Limnothrix sp. CACIAM 69d]|nr:MAG: hypothetical protein BJG00_005485 [Limnothrix sp. CACIAM 69d]
MTESQLLEAILQLPEGDRLDLLDQLMGALIHDSGKAKNLVQCYAALQDSSCLVGLTPAELNVLAHSQLTSDQQAELLELLSRNCRGMNSLSNDEKIQVDEILAEIDQLGLLKAKALYTLRSF